MPKPAFQMVLAALMLLVAAPTAAQVMVAPPIVVMSDRDRFGTFMVTNRSSEPQEVSIDFRFGYPATDSIGEIFLEYTDSVAEARYSIAGWLRAFPRQFVLGPGERQTVRFTIRPPADLAPGGYWTRLFTASVPAAPPADTVQAGGVRTQIVFRLEQVTTVLYLVGEPVMQLSGEGLQATADSTGIDVTARVQADGAPYLGTATLRFIDGAGAVAYEESHGTAIYLPMIERFRLDPGTLSPGTYRVVLSFAPGRNDLDPARTPAGLPLELSTTFTLE